MISPERGEGAEVFQKHVCGVDDHLCAKCEITWGAQHRRLSVTYRTNPSPVNQSGLNFRGTIRRLWETHISETGPIIWDTAELRGKNCWKSEKTWFLALFCPTAGLQLGPALADLAEIPRGCWVGYCGYVLCKFKRDWLRHGWDTGQKPPKIGQKLDFLLSFVRRPGLLLGPFLADLAEILRGCWGIFWLCVVQVLARSVEVLPSYRPKTTENWQKPRFLLN